jgi:hypothetical protein
MVANSIAGGGVKRTRRKQQDILSNKSFILEGVGNFRSSVSQAFYLDI